MPINLSIITQEKHLLSETVDQITAPGVAGEVTILPKHIPLFTKLNDGVIIIKNKNQVQEFAVTGGFMDVGPNSVVTILADSAVRTQDINIAKAEEARARAEDAMKNRQSEVEFKQAEAALRKAMLELKVARRRPSRPTNPTDQS